MKTVTIRKEASDLAIETLNNREKVKIEGDMISLGPVGSLPVDAYKETNAFLVAAGFKWDRKRGGHVKPGCDAAKELEGLLSTGMTERVDETKSFQFYPTLPESADRLASLLDIQKGDVIGEPSAGDGALLTAVLYEASRRFPDGHELSFVIVEENPRHEPRLRERMDGLQYDLYIQDFLTWQPDRRNSSAPNRIIANPPFTKNQDAQHILHMLEILEPGGRLVTLALPNVLSRSSKLSQQLAAKLEQYKTSGGAFEKHDHTDPSGAGTDVRTIILVVDKPL